MISRTALLLVMASSCVPRGPRPSPSTESTPASRALEETVLADLDAKADPCQDFYQYACGGWVERTPLPADKPAWFRSFSEIRERNRTAMRDMLERAAANPGGGDADFARMGNFYGSCMDEKGVDVAGVLGLAPLLADIDGVKDLGGFMRVAGELQTVGAPVLYEPFAEGDFKDPGRAILYLYQGGLGLPDRDYYLGEDPESKELLGAYEQHVSNVFKLLGEKDDVAASHAKAVLSFETDAARVFLPRAELRDPEKTYNKLDRKGLEELVPKLDWGAWLNGAAIPDAVDISVDSTATVTGLGDLVARTDIETLRALLRFHLVKATAPHLSEPFLNEWFGFYGQKVTGQKELEPRWKRCVQATDEAMGEIVGRTFVEERFPGDSKDVALSMIGSIEAAFDERLAEVSWMDDATREAARAKKNTIRNKIGYPDKWRDYSALRIEPGKHLGNVLAAKRFDMAWQLARVGKPTDPDEWYMSPPTVNAYYNPLFNEMVFPAGILQAPFFDRTFPLSMNYGGIGMVMGHELTHGFDDSGRKFDPKGRMVEWWAPEVAARFDERAACVADQYSKYEVAPGIKVDGKQTLGENIADIGGVKASYRAWRAAAGDTPAPTVDGLTEDQLFFVSFAQGWCATATPEYRKMRALSDTHSDPVFRVNGVVSDSPEFHEAFGCAVGTPMHPKETCEVW